MPKREKKVIYFMVIFFISQGNITESLDQCQIAVKES